VSLVEHESKAPSIKCKWGNDEGESIYDFRNFSGKNAESLMKQIQSHVWLISALGYNYTLEELNGFTSLRDVAMDFFRKLKGFEGRGLGIKVIKEDNSKYHRIHKFCKVTDFVASEEEAYEDDLPF
jgi:hypothetical protein